MMHPPHRRFVFFSGSNLVWALCLLLCFVAHIAYAQKPRERLSQLGHTSWRIQDGAFSGAVNAIAETKDGYLWVGTNSGLLRFDGVRFLPFAKESIPVISLLTDRDGSLWIGTASGLDRLNAQGFYHFANSDSYINAIQQTRDGKIWVVRSRLDPNEQPVCEVGATTWQCYGVEEGIPFRHAELLEVTATGDLLIGSGNTVLRWNRSAIATFVPDAIKNEKNFNGLKAILAQPDQSFLLGMAVTGQGRGLQHFLEGHWKDGMLSSGPGSSLRVATLFRDREHALWIGTSDIGLLRVATSGIERFGEADGLTGNSVRSIFEDSEGNVWVATTKGLDCFRHLAITTYSMKEGLQQESVESVVASRKGGVWVGNGGGLSHLVDGTFTTIGSKQGFPGQRVTSLFEDSDGVLWVGVDGDLYAFQEGRFVRVRRADGEATGVVARITETADHTLYVLTTGPPKHLARVNKRSMLSEDLQVAGADEIRDIDAAQQGLHIVASPAGKGIFGTYDGGKFIVLEKSTKTIATELNHADDQSTWGSGARRVFRWRDGRAGYLSMANGLPCDRYYAAIQDHGGNLWLYTRCGLIQIEKSELDRWWTDTTRTVSYKLLDAPSGALGAYASFTPSAVQGVDGRLYFANGNVVQTIDPRQPLPYTQPPPVHVEEVHVDHQNIPMSQGMQLSALPRDLEFDYTGLCLSLPQKVNFKYKLEGFDLQWQDAGPRRQAFYTDLAPGHYQFKVIAQGATGLWNTQGDSLDFAVAPAWYQRRSFLIVCVVLALAAIITGYRLRVRQIRAETQLLYDERLAERTRIARDIHDTLLQTLQGSKIVADDALDREEDTAHLKRAMRNLSDFLMRAMNEGRAALQSLRESTKETSNLAEAFREAIAECKLRETMNVMFSVEGEPRPMHPIARDEVYRIGYEAIKNACAHAEGNLLEVTLAYGSVLLLRVKDDGKGIGRECLKAGRAGHFGLGGMRERALRINAQLDILTGANAGTEIVLRVPASAIFDEPSLASRFVDWLQRIR